MAHRLDDSARNPGRGAAPSRTARGEVQSKAKPAPRWYGPLLAAVFVLSAVALAIIPFLDFSRVREAEARADAAEGELSAIQSTGIAGAADSDVLALIDEVKSAAAEASSLQNEIHGHTAGDGRFEGIVERLRTLFAADTDGSGIWNGLANDLGASWADPFVSSASGGEIEALWVARTADGIPVAFAKAVWDEDSSSFGSFSSKITVLANVHGTLTEDGEASAADTPPDTDTGEVADLVKGLEALMEEMGEPPVASEDATRLNDLAKWAVQNGVSDEEYREKLEELGLSDIDGAETVDESTSAQGSSQGGEGE